MAQSGRRLISWSARALGEECWRRLTPVTVDHGAAHTAVRARWINRMSMYRSTAHNADAFLSRSWRVRSLYGTVTAHRFPLTAAAGFGVYAGVVALGIELVRREDKERSKRTESAEASRRSALAGPALWREQAVDVAIQLTRSLFSDRSAFVPPATFLSTALFLMLSFRLNRSVSRWWRGATLWTEMQSSVVELTNSSFVYIKRRDLAASVGMWSYAFARCCEMRCRSGCVVDADAALRKTLGEYGVLPSGNITVAVRRDDASNSDVAESIFGFGNTGRELTHCESGYDLVSMKPLDALLASTNRPLFAAERIGALLAQAFDDGHIKGIRALIAMQTVVERLMRHSHDLDVTSHTPEAQSYQMHLRSTIWAWLAILPLALTPHIELAAVPIATLIAFVVFKTEAIAVAVESPFGLDRSDLPICLLNDDLQHKVKDSILRHCVTVGDDVYDASLLPVDDDTKPS